jgi:outer membrane protein
VNHSGVRKLDRYNSIAQSDTIELTKMPMPIHRKNLPLRHLIPVLLLLFPVFVSQAQESASAAVSAEDPSRSEEIREASAPLLLTLRELIIMALENNLDLSIQRISPELTLSRIEEAWGRFDPNLYLRPRYGEIIEPFDARESIAAGGRSQDKSRRASLGFGVDGVLPTNTRYDFGFGAQQTESTFTSFDPQYRSDWGLGLTQPLLRNFGTAPGLFAVRNARKSHEIALEAFEAQVINLLTRVKLAYYSLIYALESRSIQIQSLELATQLLENTRKRVEAGVLAPLEIARVEAEVARREVDVLNTVKQINQEMNDLRTLAYRDITKVRETPIQPAELPAVPPLPPVEYEDVFTLALQERPDYRQAMLAVERQNLQLRYVENQSLPQVDLTGSYRFNGIGSEFADSVVLDGDNWSVGLNVNIPIPNRVGAAQREQATLEKARVLLQLKQAEQRIMVEVDNVLQNVTTNHRSIEAAKVAEELAVRALEVENERLSVGLSTTYEVLRLQRDLAVARLQKLQSILNYHTSLAQLEQVKGTAIRDHGIKLLE